MKRDRQWGRRTNKKEIQENRDTARFGSFRRPRETFKNGGGKCSGGMYSMQNVAEHNACAIT